MDNLQSVGELEAWHMDCLVEGGVITNSLVLPPICCTAQKLS